VGTGGLGATFGNAGAVSRANTRVGAGGLGAVRGNSGAVSRTNTRVGAGGLGAGGLKSGANRNKPYVQKKRRLRTLTYVSIPKGTPVTGFAEIYVTREYDANTGLVNEQEIKIFKAEINGVEWTPEDAYEFLGNDPRDEDIDLLPSQYTERGWQNSAFFVEKKEPETEIGIFEEANFSLDIPNASGKIISESKITLTTIMGAGFSPHTLSYPTSGNTNFVKKIALNTP
jgi:hypothetical protein